MRTTVRRGRSHGSSGADRARQPAVRGALGRRAAAASVTLALGLVLAGSGTALADAPGPSQGPITLSPEQATYVCTQRIPAILSRIDRLTTRAGADAATRGSTAWLQARHDRAAGHPEVADRIQKRLDGRPEKLGKLADLKKRVTDFRDQNCAGGGS